MTSANVYYLDFIEPSDIEYNPDDRSTWIPPKVLHRMRINCLAKPHYDWEKILSLPMDTTLVNSWGYDEEDEQWDSQEGEWDDDGNYIEPDEIPTLRAWLEKMKPFSKELRELLK